MNKPADSINGGMTATLLFYSTLFMRWSIAISPPNYALCACHVTNFAVQGIQLGRHIKYEYVDAKATV